MILKQSRRALISVAALFLLAQLGYGAVSLQEVYNNAGPGQGYDKLLDLDPEEVYIGDLWITGPYHEVCIHGNGALVVPEGDYYAILVYEALLDVDHLVIEANLVGLYYSNYSCGTVSNNTIVGASDYGIRTCVINMSQGMEIYNNIVVSNGYGIYCEEDFLPQYIAYNDFWDNPDGNYILYCG